MDLVLFVGFSISLCEQAIIAAAGRRLRRHQESNAAVAHVLFNIMSCPPRFSQDLFFCMRYVRKRSFSLFCLGVEQSDEFAGSFYRFHRLCFCCPLHGLLFFPVRGNLCCNV